MDKQYRTVPKSLNEIALNESVNELLPSFDTMVNMAKNQPEKLEALRQSLIAKVIASAPERSRRRLEGLQFQIDMERRRSQSPMGSCIRISQLMNESLFELYEALDSAIKGNKPKATEQTLADVIPFPC